jgi:wyosine [tRNA(Phe)-imidazoG37] synthetase (radical SAM superfamily)
MLSEMLLSPQSGITYGPVRSRRLGRSLGINILPAGRKVCNFDCRYCQYGWTDRLAAASTAASDYPGVSKILAAVSAALQGLTTPPDYITFSGNGEPTLHPFFPDLVEGINELRDRFAPRARTAILSNSSRVSDAAIRGALARLDVRIMKLDAGTEECFRRYNRPIGELTLEAIVRGLRILPDTTLQTLFTGGSHGNMDGAEVHAWLTRVAAIRPRGVQIYTLDRDAPCADLVHATRRELEAVRTRVAALGVEAEVF